MIASLVIGIIFLVAGLALRYWINRRKFYRRSPMGAEGFSSYESSVFTKFIERIGKWVPMHLLSLGYCHCGYIHVRKRITVNNK